MMLFCENKKESRINDEWNGFDSLENRFCVFFDGLENRFCLCDVVDLHENCFCLFYDVVDLHENRFDPSFVDSAS